MSQNHFDVVIIGAGLSGIAAAYYLQTRCPNKTWTILEARDAIGGTWDLFRYPGIRSDSDMFTFGYSFRPWSGSRSYAGGEEIRRYLESTAEAYGIDRAIQFHRRVEAMRWSSEPGRWTVETRRTDTGEVEQTTGSFLWVCAGYYRYDAGYTPELPGLDAFEGERVHPQHWPEDLDWTGKRVLIVGSGATAMTLVPALAKDAAHVTMLQRTPTWVISRPSQDPVAQHLGGWLPDATVYELTRWKNILLGIYFYWASQQRPEDVKRFLLGQIRTALGEDFDVERHFKPDYKPWDQRVCMVPDGDLFEAIKSGKASVVTDTIDTFTADGVKLRSGAHLPADLVVTATGLQLQWVGGASVEVDGRPVVAADRMMYRGVMISDVPNAAVTIGYTNASWTLRCELTCELVCRTLNHMDAHGYTRCLPRVRGAASTEDSVIDLKAGYIRRAMGLLPKQGSRAPWRVYQNYVKDLVSLRRSAVEDGALEFGR